MSWSIAVLLNTVKISDSCAKELFDAYGDNGPWHDEEYVVYKGELDFNPDHKEHMDYLGNGEYSKILSILQKNKVQGDICFGSVEGDNAGSFWGYRFDGQGGMKKLKGNLFWEEKMGKLLGKTVVITGTLPNMSREEVEALIVEEGGTFSNSVTKKTDMLVVGAKPGSKLKKAQALGVSVVSADTFLNEVL